MIVLLVLISSLMTSSSVAGRGKQSHVVASGETLWEISRAYGCELERLKEANSLKENDIRPGQKLTIPRCSEASGAARSRKGAAERDEETLVLTHQITPGDTLGRIAKRYDTTIDDIRRLNDLKGNLIRPGQKLRISVGVGGKGQAIIGQSLGRPDDGELVNGMQLPRGQGYFRRRPDRSWGANHTIYHIRRSISVVRSRLPDIHDLSIGDISARKGGLLGEHVSHQSGRDVDIGFYYSKRPKGYPQNFIVANKSNLHLKATWMLLEALAATAGSASGVEKIFLDYELQGLIYEWAQKQGVSKQILKKLFQYPHGMHTPHGLIQHEPGHRHHMHVRFKCPKDDSGCR